VAFLRNNVFQNLAAFLVFLFVCLFFNNNFFEKKSTNYVWSDSEGYYSYLPKWFIYKDFAKLPVRTKVQFKKKGKLNSYFFKYPCGVAIMQAPAFLVAHAFAKISSKYDSNGYTKPYQKAILFSAMLYGFLGLLFLYKTIGLFKLDNRFALFVVLTVMFGTNMMHYILKESGMSHIYSFFWISLFSYVAFKYKDKLFTEATLITSISLGFIGLIRLPNLIVGTIPLVFMISKYLESPSKKFVLDQIKKLPIIALPFILLFAMQVFQWYEMTGEFVMYGYGRSDKGFIYWNNPKIFDVLFNVKNGWIIYSPVVAIFLLSLFAIRKQYANMTLAITLIFFMQLYLCGSWWVWSFAGGFGHRAFTDLLAIWALPFALLLSQIRHRPALLYPVLALSVILIYISIQFTIAYKYPWEPPSWNWEKYLALVKKIFFLT